MRTAFAKVYGSFEEFEREELRQLDTLSTSIDEMLDGIFMDELNFDDASVRRSRSHDVDED
jgi:hypothetical protein